MKWTLVLLNLAAAGAVVWGGHVINTAHRAHSYSVFTELEQKGALAKPSQIDVAGRLATIGGLDSNLPIVTYSAAGFFILNAVAFLAVWKKRPGSPQDSR